ncbi:hypothetical protein BOTNAR_0617g00030 [Botryotinia narcissicola]|uniref:Uncharacterized protein n=1 Tax=Botryotinia narcissicola TaxID=278944 RepID=A0A4Z1HCL4_9HELO|nr:hypothetical protein BOTNAR_0617g00030 [Botryotinia narcissicola]
MPPQLNKSIVDSLTAFPIADNNFDITPVVSVFSTTSAPPIKAKVKNPEIEKAEKVKTPPKNKAPAKEKAHPEDKEDKKEVKDLGIKGVVKEAKKEK